MKRFVIYVMIAGLVGACSEEEFYIPKPTAPLRMEFPERSYTRVADDCPYSMELATYMDSKVASEGSCHKDIDLTRFNGVIHLSYLPIDTALSAYINYSIQKVQDHIVKAAAIEDTTIINADQRIFGTFFDIQGNAASPFQFYFTDSTDHFIRGAVYFNAKPNYDSIYPVLQYVRKDLIHLMESTEWKK